MIMKNEAQKIADYESEYQNLLNEWEAGLPLRKKVCNNLTILQIIPKF